MRTMLRIILSTLALALASFAIVGVSSPANATDYYRYWIYSSVEDGAYVVADKGPGGTNPTDGSMEAYRYAAPENYKKPNLPRIDLSEVTFDSVCADTEAADGQKRVAVLIDYGTEEDAEGQSVPDPSASCAQVPTKATGLQVLQSVADVRTKSSSFGPLLCGIEGYPAKGCADVATTTATSADSGFVTIATDESTESDDSTSDDDDGGNTALYVGLGIVVVVLVAGGVFVSRRNKSTT